MIVRCPRCQTRFRLAPEKVGAKGARIRCSKCESVFRVAPQAGKGKQAAFHALIAEADADSAKAIAAVLKRWGIAADVVHDGSEALLYLHRRKPALAILGGHLPGVSAPALAEVARRSTELKAIKLIRIVTLEEPIGAPEFDADETLEAADLPAGIEPLLERLGVGRRPKSPAPEPSAPSRGAPPAPTPQQASPSPAAAPAPAPAPTPEKPAATARSRGTRSRPVSSDPQIAAAQRLARIIISDIILYNEGKFAQGVSDGNVHKAVKAELAEGIQLFEQRIPDEVRKTQDFLEEELRFRAAQLGDKKA